MKYQSPIRARSCFRRRVTQSWTSHVITLPYLTAHFALPAEDRTFSSAIPTALAANSSTRSAHRGRVPTGSRWSTLRFPSGRLAEEIVPRDAAALLWMANLACLELHPHPVRADDLDHPDELRVDLDPVPGVRWDQLRQVAQVLRGALTDFNLIGWPKTSGSRGMHVNVRLERRWTFDAVRRAALALAREVERRAPDLATSKWWKEERHGVFLDYNQNAKDRTVAAAYSVRAVADARVSAPLTWDEVDSAEPGDFTLATMPSRFAHARRSACGYRSSRLLARTATRALCEAGARRPWGCAMAATLSKASRRARACAAVATQAAEPASRRNRSRAA